MGKYSVLNQVGTGLRDELAGRIAAARRDVLRHVWIICAVFFLAVAALAVAAIRLIPPDKLAYLQRGTLPAELTGTNFLKYFIPIAMLVVGFVAGALWLRRPRWSGVGIADIQGRLADQVLDERKLYCSERDVARKEFEERVKDIKEGIRALADRHAADAVETRAKGIEDRLSRFATEAQDLIGQVEARLEPYKWLQEKKAELDCLVGIFTMGAAAERAAEFFREKRTDLAAGVAKYAIDGKLAGAASAYRTLAAELARHAQEPLAVQVIDLGLSHFPSDVNLLSDGLVYCGSLGDTAKAADFYGRLGRVDRSQWDGRAFAVAGDYLEAAGKTDEAIAIYKTLRQQMPDDERGYIRAGLLLRRTGRHDEAVEALEAGVAACRRCAQVAFMLSEISLQQGDYERAILMANRAGESTAGEPVSVDQAAITWNRAVAEDSLIHKMLNGQKTRVQKAKLLGLAHSAVLDYRTAVKMRETQAAFKTRADERQAVLRNLLAKAGVDEGQISKVFGKNGSGSNGEVSQTSQTPAPEPQSKAEEEPVAENVQPA